MKQKIIKTILRQFIFSMKSKKNCKKEGDESEKKLDRNDFLYVPSINLYVQKESFILGEPFSESRDRMYRLGERFSNAYEFFEFLKEAKKSDPQLYQKIITNSEGGGEALDTEIGNDSTGKIKIRTSSFDMFGKIIEKYERLDEETMRPRFLGGGFFGHGDSHEKFRKISLEQLLDGGYTPQGFPKFTIDSNPQGNLYYHFPETDYIMGNAKDILTFEFEKEGDNLMRYMGSISSNSSLWGLKGRIVKPKSAFY